MLTIKTTYWFTEQDHCFLIDVFSSKYCCTHEQYCSCSISYLGNDNEGTLWTETSPNPIGWETGLMLWDEKKCKWVVGAVQMNVRTKYVKMHWSTKVCYRLCIFDKRDTKMLRLSIVTWHVVQMAHAFCNIIYACRLSLLVCFGRSSIGGIHVPPSCCILCPFHEAGFWGSILAQ